MAPTVVRTVLVEGENANGRTVEQKNFDVSADDDAATISAADQVISTILGTRANATQAGHALTSTGVTWTDPVEAAALREVLATRKIENVMLVSAFMAAAALAQMVGGATGNAHTALLFVEPETATLAVIDSADGSITDVHKELISSVDTVTELAGMIAGLDALDTQPEHLFLVGSGVDVAPLKPQLEAATSLPVSGPEEPEMALARGAALASANAPIFASATAALAQAVGNGSNYAHTALLFVEPHSATLAVVTTADGSVADVRRRFLSEEDDKAVAELVEMVNGVVGMEAHPEGVVVVGAGVDIPLIKPALQAATSLPVSVPEEPKVALTQGAAPASAYAQQLNGPTVIEARNLCKSFGRWPTETPILENIDLRISPGEFVALIGPSGSGKSTLLSILGLLEPPTSGDVLINQTSVTQLSRQQLARLRGRTIGYVFQSFNLLAGLSVAENVMLPGLLAGESGRAQYDRAIALLDQFGLAALAKRVPAELSGGEQQRVAIARALFMSPAVILADEPTGNLDTTNGRKVIDALYTLNSAGQTIVLVTHDRSIADEAPRLVSLLDGRIETDSGPIQVSSHVAWRAHN